MIRKQRSMITILIVLFLFSIFSMFSCAGPDSEAPVDDNATEKNNSEGDSNDDSDKPAEDNSQENNQNQNDGGNNQNDGDDSSSSSNDGGNNGSGNSPSFSGVWDIQEDWTGCNQEGIKDYTVRIIQNENGLNFIEINDDFFFDCIVNANNELLCGGDIYNKDGDRYFFGAESYRLLFSGDDGLAGVSDWTYYPHNGEACNGHSVLSAIRAENDENSSE